MYIFRTFTGTYNLRPLTAPRTIVTETDWVVPVGYLLNDSDDMDTNTTRPTYVRPENYTLLLFCTVLLFVDKTLNDVSFFVVSYFCMRDRLIAIITTHIANMSQYKRTTNVAKEKKTETEILCFGVTLKKNNSFQLHFKRRSGWTCLFYTFFCI